MVAIDQICREKPYAPFRFLLPVMLMRGKRGKIDIIFRMIVDIFGKKLARRLNGIWCGPQPSTYLPSIKGGVRCSLYLRGRYVES